jgi:hypothetical protein
MVMSEKALLYDCFESLKNAAGSYIQYSSQCDSPDLAGLFKDLGVDKCEAGHAIYNLMHQAGIITTQSVDPAEIHGLIDNLGSLLGKMKGPSQPASREIPSPNV